MAALDFETARFNMIEQQIRPWDVLDQQVLDLIATTPREDFVPEGYRTLAFQDIEIPLGHGETMLSPKLEGKIMQALQVQPSEKVLEVGTGSGYLTALLARAAHQGKVFSIDIHAEFQQAAAAKLEHIGVNNVLFKEGNAARGWDSNGTFDVIAVTGSLPELPERFKIDLEVGGRMFIVVGDAPIMQALLITRTGDREWTEEVLFETVLPPLQGATRTRRFTL